MSFGSFINAPFRGDRGKRILTDSSAYVQQDYLKDTRPEEQKRTHVVGKSDGRQTKFKVGFYRRPAAAIQPDAERRAQEEQRQVAMAPTNESRAAALAAVNSRNGNVLVPEAAPDAKLFPKRRAFPQRQADVSAQNHARQRVGASRFHLEPTAEEQEARKQHLEQRLQAQAKQGAVSLMGYGRADLPSGGVADVFRGVSHGADSSSSGSGLKPWTNADLISKPKLRPPPADSIAAQRMAGQIRLEDGSAAGQSRDFRYGAGGSRKSLSHAGREGSPSSAAAILREAGAMPVAGAYRPLESDKPFTGGVRVSRANNTSQGMKDAFTYNAVAAQQQQPRQQQQQQHQQQSTTAAASGH